MGRIISFPTEGTPMKARRFPIGPKSAALFRTRIHQGRKWTQTLRTPRILELEYLRLDDKTFDGVILSSLLRNVRRGPVCESFEAKLHAPCMTAMISGPRYGSTSELQVRRTQPNLAHEDNTRRPLHYSPNGKKICTHPKEGPAGFRITYFRPGNICRSSVLYRAKHDNTTWGVVPKQWQVPSHF